MLADFPLDLGIRMFFVYFCSLFGYQSLPTVTVSILHIWEGNTEFQTSRILHTHAKRLDDGHVLASLEEMGMYPWLRRIQDAAASLLSL